METINFRRHGDVSLHPITKEEFEAFQGKLVKHKAKYTIAHGEATGSTHDIHCSKMIIKEDGEERVIAILKAATITHTHDHEPLTIQPGTYYRQVPEREVDNFSHTTRKVRD